MTRRFPREAMVFMDVCRNLLEAMDIGRGQLEFHLLCRTLNGPATGSWDVICDTDYGPSLRPLTPAAREMLAIAKGGRR